MQSRGDSNIRIVSEEQAHALASAALEYGSQTDRRRRASRPRHLRGRGLHARDREGRGAVAQSLTLVVLSAAKDLYVQVLRCAQDDKRQGLRHRAPSFAISSVQPSTSKMTRPGRTTATVGLGAIFERGGRQRVRLLFGDDSNIRIAA